MVERVTLPEGVRGVRTAVRSDGTASARPERLKRRRDFVAAAKGVRVHRNAFSLQALRRLSDARIGSSPRVGFTVTKKVGNAVVRNRIRRRLRALSERLTDEFARSTDYVIVARVEALDAPFGDLGTQLSAALVAAAVKLDRPQTPDRPDRPPRGDRAARPSAKKRA